MTKAKPTPPVMDRFLRLVSEAYEVKNETGLTPRQLWENVQEKDHIIMDQSQHIFRMHEQLAELLEALKALTAATWYIVDGSSPNNPIRKHLSNAEAAIARFEAWQEEAE